MAVVIERVEKVRVKCGCPMQTCKANISIKNVGGGMFGVTVVDTAGVYSYVMLSQDGLRELNLDIDKLLAD